MTILFIFVVIIFVAVLRNWRKTALFLLAFLSIHLVLSGGGVITRIFMRDLQSAPRITKPEWKDRNAIVILGFGTVKWSAPAEITSASFAYARLFEGLRLYTACKKASNHCRILVTGGDPMRTGESEASVMARELEEAGVDRSDLLIEGKSNNTFANARFSAPMLEGFEQIYLVTSGIHMKRATLYFAHFVKGMIPAPADKMDAILSIIPISPNLIFFDFALHEYLGILRYKIYNLMEWNPPKVI